MLVKYILNAQSVGSHEMIGDSNEVLTVTPYVFFS